ncbi:MAG: hypothetical protein AB7H96_20530 [Vicinamibacterales bacterium]
MPDFNVRSDAVNVEQIMEQIRARIREKRGVDYTEAEIRELASVKLEKFLDPRGVRSDLLEQYRKAQPPYAPPELPNYAFEAQTLFESTRGPLRAIRKLLLPILKLFFNPNPLIQALNIQSRLNATLAEREAKRDAARYAFDQLHYEVMHNLVMETTRLGIEVKNLKMRIESLSSRLEFNERRARALEGAVVYKPADDERETRRDEPRREDHRREGGRRDDHRRDESRRQESRRQEPAPQAAPPQPQPVAPAAATPEATGDTPVADAENVAAAAEGPGQRSRRRRRRRGRRGSGAAAALMTGGQPTQAGTEESEDQGGPDDGEGDGDAETGAEVGASSSAPSPESDGDASDVRTTRPVPFEHAFGAQAHPAESAASDPAGSPAASPRAESTSGSPEPAGDTPATPEQ